MTRRNFLVKKSKITEYWPIWKKYDFESQNQKFLKNGDLNEYEISKWKLKIFDYDVETDFLENETLSRTSKISEIDDFDSTKILAQKSKIFLNGNVTEMKFRTKNLEF